MVSPRSSPSAWYGTLKTGDEWDSICSHSSARVDCLEASAVGAWKAANVLGHARRTLGMARGALRRARRVIALVTQVSSACAGAVSDHQHRPGCFARAGQGPAPILIAPYLRRLRVPHPVITRASLGELRPRARRHRQLDALLRPEWRASDARTPRPGTQVSPRRASARWRPSSSCSGAGVRSLQQGLVTTTPLPDHRGAQCALRWRGPGMRGTVAVPV